LEKHLALVPTTASDYPCQNSTSLATTVCLLLRQRTEKYWMTEAAAFLNCAAMGSRFEKESLHQMAVGF
jgi:hypothetical protein